MELMKLVRAPPAVAVTPGRSYANAVGRKYVANRFSPLTLCAEGCHLQDHSCLYAPCVDL